MPSIARHIAFRSAAIMGALMLSACAPAAIADNADAAGAAAEAARSALTAAIGGAACDSAQQCKTVAIVIAQCGGSASYLAYSTKVSDGARIARLARAYGSALDRHQQAQGLVLNCAILADPGATCSARRCVAGAPRQQLGQ